MQPESAKLLWDARGSAQWIQERVAGITFQSYLGDQMLRLAVERQFIIVGEALGQFTRSNPAAAKSITEVEQVIAFRNILVHGYGEVDDHLVWTMAMTELDALIQALDRLLHPESA